jgi:hypothetical protein
MVLDYKFDAGKALFISNEEFDKIVYKPLVEAFYEAGKKFEHKTNELFRLKKENDLILDFRDKDFKEGFNKKNNLYYPSANPEGLSLFNLFGLIHTTISGDIFLLPSFKKSSSGEISIPGLPSELKLYATAPHDRAKIVYHYVIGLSEQCTSGLKSVDIMALFEDFFQNQKANFIETGISLSHFSRPRDTKDTIELIENRINKLRFSFVLRKYIPELSNQLSHYYNLIKPSFSKIN